LPLSECRRPLASVEQSASAAESFRVRVRRENLFRVTTYGWCG
jgi:hypothetical protein